MIPRRRIPNRSFSIWTGTFYFEYVVTVGATAIMLILMV